MFLKGPKQHGEQQWTKRFKRELGGLIALPNTDKLVYIQNQCTSIMYCLLLVWSGVNKTCRETGLWLARPLRLLNSPRCTLDQNDTPSLSVSLALSFSLSPLVLGTVAEARPWEAQCLSPSKQCAVTLLLDPLTHWHLPHTPPWIINQPGLARATSPILTPNVGGK